MRKFTYYGSLTSFTGLLDTYSGANLGLSLRRLRASFSGNLVTIVRASDLAEQSFGLVNNLVDVAGINAFLGASEGRVSYWADQSPNENHAVQSVFSLMPVFSSDGGFPVIYMNSRWMNLTNTITETINTKIGVGRRFEGGSSEIDIHFFGTGAPTGVNTSALGVFANFGFTYFLGNNKSSLNYTTPINFARFILWGSDDGTNVEFRKDGASIFVAPGTQTLINSINKIGVYLSDSEYNSQGGIFHEIIHYPTSRIADVSGIETNINTYYGLY